MNIVDYSNVYYPLILKKPVPTDRKGKFVLVTNLATQEEFFVMSPIELSKFHANIVERFCLVNKIQGAYANAKRDNFRIFDSDWHAQGGGFWEINSKKESIALFGSSQAYGGCNIKELRKNIAYRSVSVETE